MTTPQDLVSALQVALQAEDDALEAVSRARASQAQLLAQLRDAGVPTTRAVHRVVVAAGAALPIRDRLRLAERLRKRARRGTRRPALLPGQDGAASPAPISSTTRAITPAAAENTMGKVLKKRVTEEWISTDDVDDLEVIGEIDEDDEESEEEEDAPTKRSTRRK